MSTPSTSNTVKLEDLTQAILKAQPKNLVVMLKFGNREGGEIGWFLELSGRAQKWSYYGLIERLPLSLTHNAVAWYPRNKTQNTWQDQNDVIMKEFCPHGFTGYKRKALERRIMQKDESVNAYFEGVMLLQDVLEGLNKTFTEQEEADKLTSGIRGTEAKTQRRSSCTFLIFLSFVVYCWTFGMVIALFWLLLDGFFKLND